MTTPDQNELRQKMLKAAQDNFDEGEYIIDGLDWRRFLDELEALIQAEILAVVNEIIDVSFQEVIDAGLFPTPEEYVKMVGLMDLQRSHLGKLKESK